VPDWVNQTVPAPQPTNPPWSAATVTLTPVAVAIGPTDDGMVELIPPAVIQMEYAALDENGDDDEGTSPLLIAAVVLQVTILGIAGFEFLRRR